MNLFDDQRHRGTQGFGLFDGQECNLVRHSKEDGILKWLDKYPSNMIMFHHRYPTSTVNVKRAAHPFSTKDYFGDTQYILVHNGSIRNADELFVDHQELGIEYQSLLQDMTFNDSEALLWDFALTLEGRQKEMKAYGPMAIACLKLVGGKIERLYFGRNTNPLNLFRDKDNFILSSEGEGESIDTHTLYNYHYDSNRLTKRDFNLPSWKSSYEYGGGYSHKGFPGSYYTPNSYASKQNAGVIGNYPTLYDCNCEEVGWEYCEYHGDPYLNPNPADSANDGFDHVRNEITDAQDDDSDAYNRWWQEPEHSNRDGSAGDWLPPKLRYKFRGLLDAASKSKNTGKRRKADYRQKPDYEYDPKTKLMLPAGEIPDDVVSDIAETGVSLEEAMLRSDSRRKAIMAYLTKTGNLPDDEEIATEYMAYLGGSRGHFQQAYWQMEDDYTQLEDAPDTLENVRKCYLIECVIDRLQSDPEYEHEESISSVWEEIWKQNKQTQLT